MVFSGVLTAAVLAATAQVDPAADTVAPTAKTAPSAETETAPPPEIETQTAIDAAPATLLVPRDTPVHFMVLSEVTTKTHGPGHRFKLRVDRPVVIDGHIAIPVGATGWGEVTDAESSGNVGKSGKLSARLLYVEAKDVQVPVNGTNSAKGAGGTGETVLGVLALGPLGLFAKGNNAKIKAGELMTGFVEQDTAIAMPATAGQ